MIQNQSAVDSRPYKTVSEGTYPNYPYSIPDHMTISNLKKSAVSELFEKAKTIRYNRDENIILEGYDPDDVLVIFSGLVKVISYENEVRKSATFQTKGLKSGDCRRIVVLTIAPGPISLFTSENSGFAVVSEPNFCMWLVKHKKEKPSIFLYS